MRKFFVFCIFFILFSGYAFPAFAQSEQSSFRAKILEIRDESVRVVNKDGEQYEIEQLGPLRIKPGQSVVVSSLVNENSEVTYFITDVVRVQWIWMLIILFMLTVVIINRKHGVKSLINLAVTFGILIFVVVPLILKGYSPVFMAILGGIVSMVWNIYFAHGINKKSHAALLGIAGSLIIAGLLSGVFVRATNLSGLVQEEAVYLQAIGFENINMQGLLLAAIIIGVLGVLDDLAINQISVIEELTTTKHNMGTKELMARGLKIGRDHTGAIINTLMLAYAGAAFPLLLLVTLNQPPFETMFGILNNEVIATEIIRTLVGTICIVLTMPITTFVGAQFYKKRV